MYGFRTPAESVGNGSLVSEDPPAPASLSVAQDARSKTKTIMSLASYHGVLVAMETEGVELGEDLEKILEGDDRRYM